MAWYRNLTSPWLPCALALAIAFPAPAMAADVTMAFGEKIPPFCFPATDSGIEIEIIREALAYRGHKLKPVYLPFARVPVTFRSGGVDAAMSDLGEDMSSGRAYYGDPAVFYSNVFITLRERHIAIKRPEDLNGLTVLAFSGALRRYPAWLDKVKKEGRYFEQNDQSLQVLTLSASHYDVVLSDKNIFKYFTRLLEQTKGVRLRPVEMHNFTTVNPMDYRPVFHDGAIRDDFNAGLKQMKRTGRVEAIYRKYLLDLQDDNDLSAND